MRSDKREGTAKDEAKINRKGGFFPCLLRVFLVLLFILSVVALIVGIVLGLYIDRKVEKHVDESLFTMVGADSAKLYYDAVDENGERVTTEIPDTALYGGYRCIYAPYESVPQAMIDAFVSIEDKRFFEHKGVDWFRTVSAGMNYFLKFNRSYGGSTITQQLVKNVTDKDDYSFQRKIQEIFWAIDLETKMDKDEILGLYLNVINLSQGCYGVRTAARYYYSKELSELTLAECASIAAITNSPSYYDPLRYPEHNKQRRDLILREMCEQGYIDEAERDAALAEEIVLTVDESMKSNQIHSWYVDMVIEDVIGDLMEQKGYSRSMASLVVYTGGIHIYTVMDAEVQGILEEYYAESSHFYTDSGGENPQCAMIVIHPTTGDILGVAGAVGEKTANRIQNFATQTLRPAGSVIKPLSVYAPALENGIITWGSVYDDVPVRFGTYNLDPSKGEIVQPSPWPQNANRTYRGLTNINYAVEHSVNTVTIRVLEQLGIDAAFDFLYDRLHMENLIEVQTQEDGTVITDKDYAALGLGQFNYGVTLEETTAAYSIFANDGIYNHPRSYSRVTDANGSVILEKSYRGEAVISEGNAAVMTEMLQNVVTNGSAKEITLDTRVACAGKTGTTQNNCDRWYIGYTPYLIGGVWYGYEYPKSLSGISGNPCLTVWDEVMTRLHEKYTDQAVSFLDFDECRELVEAEFCADSGQLMTEACRRDARGSRAEKGYFVRGSEPTEYCTCHRLVAYDTVSGGVACDQCPADAVEYVGMISVERYFPMSITVTDAQYVYRDLGDVMPETSPGYPFFQRLLKENEYCGISKGDVQYNRFCRRHFDYVAWKEKHGKEE